ncbi:hypothetical protein DBR17_17700 [Sphingomonas sp. HMWF008]|nr:hypothetical protein DBR17_17700 [Sphingomonas sp. HMWF008]
MPNRTNDFVNSVNAVTADSRPASTRTRKPWITPEVFTETAASDSAKPVLGVEYGGTTGPGPS